MTGQYRKGALVLAELDHRIRTASNGSQSLETVVATMNEQDDPVTYREFRSIVANQSDTETAEWLDTAVKTSETPGFTPKEEQRGFDIEALFDSIDDRLDGLGEGLGGLFRSGEECSSAGVFI